MWGRKTVSSIFPISNDDKSVIGVINEFDATGYIDEIIVVGHNPDSLLEEELKKARIKFIRQSNLGLGNAIKTGIKETKADLIITVEANGSYKGKDVLKLLAYSDDFDTVFGSRTHLPLIQQGSGMIFLRRLINTLLGRLISLLFVTYPLTDVGCGLRLTNQKGWNQVSKQLLSDDWLFWAEWVIKAAKNKVRFQEIPVNFRRPGKNSIKFSFMEQTRRGFIIFFNILRVWMLQKFFN